MNIAPSSRVRVTERVLDLPADQWSSIYAVIAQRRTAFDTLMWQVPALGLAAQAFLLTIAFGSSSSEVARFFAGGLAAVVALVAIQTMLKHRANEKTDSLILEKMEAAVGISVGMGIHPHDPPAVRGRGVGNDLTFGYLARRRSVTLWITSLLCFATAGIGAIVLTLCDPTILSG
jgi:hypothetical protein